MRPLVLLLLAATPAFADELNGRCVVDDWDSGSEDPDCVLGTCEANGVCESGCTFRDPDCPSRTLGAPCEEAADCESAMCSASSNVHYCSAPCTDDEECLPGMRCYDRCQWFSVRPPGSPGDPCGDAADCLTGLCLTPPTGTTYCSTFCPACEAGSCLTTQGQMSVCALTDPGDCGAYLRVLPFACCQVAPGARAGALGAVLLCVILLHAPALRRGRLAGPQRPRGPRPRR